MGDIHSRRAGAIAGNESKAIMCRVLFIEDNPEVRHQLAATLRQAGHEVADTDNGRDGLLQLEALPAEIAIIDILMPERDGFETIRAVKAVHPEISIVAISGGGLIAGIQYLQMALLLGAHRTLEKPIWPAQLLAVVSELSAAA